MTTSRLCQDDIQAAHGELTGIVDQAQSLPEIQSWLEAQPCVSSVTLADALIKTNPPQRAVTIALRDPNGMPQDLVLMLFELPNGRYQVRDLRRA